MSPPVVRAIVQIAVCSLLAVPAGLLFGAWVGWAMLAALLAWQLFYHLRHFARLVRWSCAPSPDRQFEGEGAWDEVFGRLYRHEKSLRGEIARRDEDLRQVAAAAEALTDGIVTLDTENRIAWCNSTAARQLGLSLATDRGQPITNIVRQPPFIGYLAAGEFSRPLLLHSDRSGGEVLSIQMLPYAGGNRLMQVRDVTQSERLDRMRRDFVANVSHELRTPLTVLSGFIETVRELELDESEQERYLSLMGEQSARMLSIVQDLLTLSTLESSPPPENERVDMRTLLDKIGRDAVALSGGRHDIRIEADAGDLFGAESELASAFGNLVTNAIRYTPEGGEIRIAWQAVGHGAAFSVTDNGIGIDPKHIPRLTERFYRADAGRSRAAGGTGLGLAIVKHALSRHQATLDITSAPGRGSCFRARFPAHRLAS